VSLAFRWLGVAGIELRADSQMLALDPFFTRPSLLQLLHPLQSDASLAAEKLPACDVILVTHSHYDHLLDVPAVLRQTAAIACGSPNTCQLLNLLGVPADQLKQVQVGDQLSFGAFQVQVIQGRHRAIPFDRFFNGQLPSGLQPPLRAWDYRMDVCLGFLITVMGTRLLVCAAQPQPADVLFAVAQETSSYYLNLFKGVQPSLFIPIHWDNFTRPLSRPLRRFARPGKLSLMQINRLARQVLPHLNVIVPEIFREYTLQ
jgi:L-ascorbate metabolism protein UlaG (beta-lactamase superfamily)